MSDGSFLLSLVFVILLALLVWALHNETDRRLRRIERRLGIPIQSEEQPPNRGDEGTGPPG
jgi:hypothetical protein